jgi:diguanylate cyclase (GGDEF)-like protein/PAS domain S-box-containing protein
MPRFVRRTWAGHGARASSERAGTGRLRRPVLAARRRVTAAQADLVAEGQNGILEMIASGAPLPETLDSLLRLIESSMPEVLGSILLLDADGKRLRHAAAPSLPPAFCRSIDGEPIGPSAGSCGTAAFRRDRVIVEDIENDPLWTDYRQLAAVHGLRACWSTPILNDRREVLGTFAMYFRTPGRPSERHLQVIRLTTHTAAIAITKQNGERERESLVGVLGERVKELTLLHGAARLLQRGRSLDDGLLSELVTLIPPAWKYPEVCEARIACGGLEARTPRWRKSPWTQSARIATGDGRSGILEVAYLEERPDATEGPFLAEERALLRSLADMASGYLERARVAAALQDSEAMFRSIFEKAAIGMTLVDMQGRIVKCNPELARLLGYEGSELAGVRFADITYPEDREANERLYRALAAGGRDHFRLEKRYLRKDGTIMWGELNVSLVPGESGAPRFTIGMVEDITARKEAEDRVRHLAYYEPVTGLPNRALLRDRLGRAMADARACKRPLALLLANLNNFREINDTLGHHNGDDLLRQVAASLRAVGGEPDTVACLGGDEYALLLTGVSGSSDVEAVVARLTAALRRPLSIAGIPVNVEASLGIALYPDHGDTPESLWQHADVALRAAKKTEQNHLFYHAEIDHYDPRRLALLGQLREAIERNELVLHYQPTIDLDTGVTVAVEALVRWQHPAHGLIYPDSFVPLAERTHLINPLTAWVLVNALDQGQAWRGAGLRLGLSANLSARNLHDPGLCAGILALARRSHFPLEHLTVEITESAIMADPALARNVLAQLHEAGIGLSVDDFGIGQSSLAYLRDLPISRMKIDRSFVMDFSSPRNAAIVRSAIELGHNLGLPVTAEGVEDERTMVTLRGMGCDVGQGNYFAKPMPVDRLTAWLRESPWKCVSS